MPQASRRYVLPVMRNVMPKNMNAAKFNSTVKLVSDLLAKKQYDELVKLSNGVRLTPVEIEKAVKDYGREIIPLPQEGFSQIDVIEVEGTNPRKWSVNVPVFTMEEGMSDLTLELTLIESWRSHYRVEVDDLHVL
jgi:hypothetical protein